MTLETMMAQTSAHIAKLEAAIEANPADHVLVWPESWIAVVDGKAGNILDATGYAANSPVIAKNGLGIEAATMPRLKALKGALASQREHLETLKEMAAQ